MSMVSGFAESAGGFATEEAGAQSGANAGSTGAVKITFVVPKSFSRTTVIFSPATTPMKLIPIGPGLIIETDTGSRLRFVSSICPAGGLIPSERKEK